MEDNKKRVRDSADSDSDDLELEVMKKKMREDLLAVLDDTEPDPETLGLDSVIKSFQDEIASLSSFSPVPAPVVVDLVSDSAGESQPELGYLLEASDDDLGLPPSASANSSGDEVKDGEADSVRFDSLWGLEDNIPSYDSFELVDNSIINSSFEDDNEYVAFGDVGLFDYSDVCFGSTEFSDFSWRAGSMPAE